MSMYGGYKAGMRAIGSFGRKRSASGTRLNRKGAPMKSAQLARRGKMRVAGAGGAGMLMVGSGGSSGGGGRSSATRGITPRSSGGRTL